MKQLNKLQLTLYTLGGVMILIGAFLFPASHEFGGVITGSPKFAVSREFWGVIIYSVGAILFASMQMLARYEGTSIVIRRLRRQQIIGALLLLLSGAAMFANIYGITCLRHNEWLAVLAIAAVLELYTAFRIPQELRKEQRGG